MSFVSNGGKFKLYTVLNGLIFPTPTQPRISFERPIFFYLAVQKILFCIQILQSIVLFPCYICKEGDYLSVFFPCGTKKEVY
jgi:hypothetical protein